ncbi:transcription-repair coupling factor [Nakamurella sp. A5-74]|uniref:Transcription-repair-coupling factor n=1 Tax=Nakamurella sp. A5-74 TaxID=3158264 RepID=A0AAU8DUD4_9ACTN
MAAADSPARTFVAPPGTRPFVVAALAGADRPVLLVTATGREAEIAATAVDDLLGVGAAMLFPSWETLPHERLSPRADTVGARLAVLRRLAHPDESMTIGGHESAGPVRVIVTTVRSLIQPMAPNLGEIVPVRLKVGDEMELEKLTARLVDLAYTRVDMVEKRGEMAVRGGIVDVFPPTASHPIRIEFWGDEVTDLREFAVTDQRSLGTVDAVEAAPCREILLTEEVRRHAGDLSAAATGDPTLTEMLAKIADGIGVEGMESLLPALIPGGLTLLTDLLDAGTHVLLADPERIRSRADDLVRTGNEFLAASWMAAATGGKAPIDLGASAYRDLDAVLESAVDRDLPVWRLAAFGVDVPTTAAAVDAPEAPSVRASHAYRGDIAAAVSDAAQRFADGGRTVLVVPAAGTAQRAVERLREADLGVQLATSPMTGELGNDAVTVAVGRLDDGFDLPATHLTVLTESDLTGTRGVAGGESVKMPSRRRNAIDPLSLVPGDFVVHAKHGIGKFVQMVTRTTSGAQREYLVVEYAPSKRGHPGDKLFVPTDALDQLSKYVGGELPPLSKMGGSDWAKTKGKARKAVRQIAAKLVQVYAARAAAPGHPFAPDTPWQRELEDAFPFTETPDQLAAINEVKADMEKPSPMDRVISGDVGYGKTEIAVRAAFKAVQDGKQVAILVPTTLLAQQHLSTFGGRMSAFPVNIKGLSRFTDDAEAKQTVLGLIDGSVDIVIGTHRLLQPSIRYHDLGLVVVDEEQRFGVEHKEHITALRAHVDMLTMSATPIPRTLEMSLAGIREMSTITTPPEERHPILTYVGAYDDALVAAAIRRELLRDGQVFLVHNRVSDIDAVSKRIRDAVPEARVAVGHGQMGEGALEQVIDGFWKREVDVLVCTTIVETGLDISNANTLIVDHAEILGLSQMHQLRGRVGRGRERGYAYFLYPADKILTETAHDRLATIAQNSDLGAGMAVAMRDLEIRGAGSILGAEQSGHIAGVGFDLYIRLVGEAVTAFKKSAKAAGEEVPEEEEPIEVRIELPIDASIPHDYVPTDRLRLDAYRKIAGSTDEEQLTAVADELVDRYGPFGTQVENLFAVARFRFVAAAAGVSEVILGPQGLRFAPIVLAESAQLRAARLYPGSKYKEQTHALTLRAPTERSGGLGAPGLRDVALLEYCAQVFTELTHAPALAGDAAATGPRR